MSDSSVFQPGQLVRLKSQPDSCGAVIAVNDTGPEIQYSVLLDGKSRTFFGSQLIAEDQDSDTTTNLSADECRALLTARYINHPGTSTLYSLNAARIDYIPYQFRPVLRFIRADRPRLLIADGVGVGKTIEAGLILKELQARQDVNSVLIICPRPLITEKKWQTEMKRFDQNFEHIDGTKLQHCISACEIDEEWPEKYRFGIIPYSIMNERMLYGVQKGKKKRKKGLLDLDTPPRFDLVIVDEAHRISNPETYGHQIVRFFCDNADAVVFLTATPLQLGQGDLFSLLNLLRPDVVIDRESFNYMSEPNPKINSAVNHARSAAPGWHQNALQYLQEATDTSWGQKMFTDNPDVLELEKQLDISSVDDTKRVEIINKLEELHTFSGIINRTRRRDINTFTIRRPETIEVPFTPPQKELHDQLLKVQSEIFTQLHGSQNVLFMMTTIRRQAASCLFGLTPFIHDILGRHLSELDLSEVDLNNFDPDTNELTALEEKICQVIVMAKELPAEDPKLQAMISIIQQKNNAKEHKNHRVMLFSSFRHTLRYLENELRNVGIRVGMIHGGVEDDDRTELRERFEYDKNDPEALDVLLFSEVGCEGLDYQFCDCMVNYDLPWNPMRVEQRIGRIDRNGQQSEFVSIFNLITPGTVDADIYDRCLLRIGVFEEAMGASEEILGEITGNIQSIALDPTLTSNERQEKLQQLADNQIRLIQEEQNLEDQQSALFGLNLPTQQRFMEEVENASSYWLTPDAMNNLLQKYLDNLDSSAEILGGNLLKTLRTNQNVRSQLLSDFIELYAKKRISHLGWERWLKGSESNLLITFDGQCANTNREAHLLTPMHPLIRQAAKALDHESNVEVHLSISDNNLPEGVYPFAVYQWELLGLRRDLEIVPITMNEEINARLLEFLQYAKDAVRCKRSELTVTDIEEFESKHYLLWKQALNGYQKRVIELAKFKIASLTASYEGRMELLNNHISSVNDEKIRRMRESQIDTASRDYQQRIKTLNRTSEQADITTERIMIGTLIIRRN